jgi:hypothetical protein
MAVNLDLADIQGNILTAYGKLGFPKGRFILLHVDDGAAGRRFVTAVLPSITTALRWPSLRAKIPTGAHVAERPQVAANMAFSFFGLLALGVPVRTLRGMPDEFIDGMMARAPMLGDDFGGRDPGRSWDEVWSAAGSARQIDPNAVHILIALNAQMNADGTPVAALDAATAAIESLCRSLGGVRVLPGHNPRGGPPARYQELSAITRLDNGTATPLPTEHFGFVDAIGDPVFEGQYPERYERRAPSRAPGRSTGQAIGARSPPANSCSAIPTRRRRSPAPPCRSGFRATARSWPIASCSRTSPRSAASSRRRPRGSAPCSASTIPRRRPRR